MPNYKLKLEMFEGPLDLLLYLIRKNELDICDIAIRDVTDQYLEYIDLMKELNLDIVGDFLVMAATLMQIKSRELLPANPEGIEDEEEDPADDLVRRLQEYKKFKEAAEDLKQKASDRQDWFARQVDQEILNEIKEDATEVYFEANLFDLITALNKALQQKPKKVSFEVKREEFTVEEKIHDLLHMLVQAPKVRLNELFQKAVDKMEVIVTFIAVLELIKQREICVLQSEMFGDIDVLRNEKNINVHEDVPNNPFSNRLDSSSFEG